MTTCNSAAILGLRWGSGRTVQHIYNVAAATDPKARGLCGYGRPVGKLGQAVGDGRRCKRCVKAWRKRGTPAVHGAYTLSFLPGEPGYAIPGGGDTDAEREAQQGHEGRQAPVGEQAQVAG